MASVMHIRDEEGSARAAEIRRTGVTASENTAERLGLRLPSYLPAKDYGDRGRSAAPVRVSGTPGRSFVPLSTHTRQGRMAVQLSRRALRSTAFHSGALSSIPPQETRRPRASLVAIAPSSRGDRSHSVQSRRHRGVEFNAELVHHQKGVLSGEVHNYGVQPSSARTALLASALAWRRRG